MRSGIASVLLLLTAATPAQAECAWVLWVSGWVAGHGMTEPSPIGAFEDKAGCEQEIKDWNTQNPPSDKVFVDHVCFPDTVDPRRPR